MFCANLLSSKWKLNQNRESNIVSINFMNMEEPTANLGTQERFPIRIWELAFYVIISAFGITGNSIVLAVLKRKREMRCSAFGVYLSTLAVVDILVCVLCLPVYVTSTEAFKSHPTGQAGDIVCKLWTNYFVLFYFAVISVFTLVAISVERYLAICKPMKARIKSTPKRARRIVICILILSLVPNFALIAGLKYAKPGENSFGAHCTAVKFSNDAVWKVFYVIVLLTQYVIPISLMIICFIKIKRTLRRYALDALANNKIGLNSLQSGHLLLLRTRARTTRTVVIMILAYFLCWSLNQVLYFMLNIGYGVAWNGDLMQISVVLCFFSSCINPIIYVSRSRQFREDFKKLLCRSPNKTKVSTITY